MRGSTPRVTVGVPVYNGERYLATCLDSLSDQTFESMEIIVSDNASTDNTPDIISDAARRDPRIRHVRHQQNQGGVWNVNYLLNAGTGQEFKWAYYDDVLAPTFISACVQALDAAGEGTAMAYTRATTIDADGQVIEERNDRDLGLDAARPHVRVHRLLHSLANQTEFGLMRTSRARRTRGVQPYIGSEMYFLVELAVQGGFIGIDEQLLSLRRHDEQYGRDRFTEARWYASSGKPQSLLPFTKMNALLARSVLESSLPPAERAKSLIAVATGWTIPRRRTIASDLRHLPRTWRERNHITGERPTTDDQASVRQNSNR